MARRHGACRPARSQLRGQLRVVARTRRSRAPEIVVREATPEAPPTLSLPTLRFGRRAVRRCGQRTDRPVLRGQVRRQPWPIDPGHAALIIEALNPILPGWVRAERIQGFTATFKLNLRGQATHIWAFGDGRLQVNPPHPGVIDVHISGDSAALLLVFYARESQWKHIATGRILAWGRKPWLALTLTSYFHKP
jgi:hypothetical protein